MSKHTETSDEVSASDASASRPRSAAADTIVDPRFRVGELLLGKYRIEHVLGQGGMGMVLGARHAELGELFALKFMRSDAIIHPAIVERFMREARAMARLHGPHVARVYDVGRLESGEPYMLMEHLSGQDLEHLLDAHGPLELEELTEYVVDACDAIAEAHAAGIVHRDLKPSNLFLNEQRGKRVIKVLDFGISKERDTGRARLTSTHSLLGSPLYMSPEQALEPKVVDARSDIWSLGVSLYELATGVAPFDADGVPEVVAKILQHDPPPPSSLRSDLPAWFDAIVMRCLAKPMHERFQRVEELAEAIVRRDVDVDLGDPKTRVGVSRDSVLPSRPVPPNADDERLDTARTRSAKRVVSRTPSGTERIELPQVATATGFGTFTSPSSSRSALGAPRSTVSVFGPSRWNDGPKPKLRAARLLVAGSVAVVLVALLAAGLRHSGTEPRSEGVGTWTQPIANHERVGTRTANEVASSVTTSARPPVGASASMPSASASMKSNPHPTSRARSSSSTNAMPPTPNVLNDL